MDFESITFTLSCLCCWHSFLQRGITKPSKFLWMAKLWTMLIAYQSRTPNDRINATANGFEPLWAEPNWFLIHHLNHSVTLPCLCVMNYIFLNLYMAWSKDQKTMLGLSNFLKGSINKICETYETLFRSMGLLAMSMFCTTKNKKHIDRILEAAKMFFRIQKTIIHETWNASAENRTRVTSMATMYSTTRPLMHAVCMCSQSYGTRNTQRFRR